MHVLKASIITNIEVPCSVNSYIIIYLICCVLSVYTYIYIYVSSCIISTMSIAIVMYSTTIVKIITFSIAVVTYADTPQHDSNNSLGLRYIFSSFAR